MENTSLLPFVEIWELPEVPLLYRVFGCLPSSLLCFSSTSLCSYHSFPWENPGWLWSIQWNSHFLYLKDKWAKIMPSCSCMTVPKEVKDQLKVICCDKVIQ